MGKWPVPFGSAINANAAHQFRVRAFDTIGRIEDDAGIAVVDAPIAVQIVHTTIPIIVHVHVRRVAIHMAAQTRPTITTESIVLRRAEPAHDGHTTNDNTLL